MANPTGKGGFQKGHSGNPGGRPKVIEEVRELFQEYSKEAADGLLAIAKDTDAPKAARVAAWNSILDRALGRPEQSMKIENTEKSAAQQWIEILKEIGETRAKEARAKEAKSKAGEVADEVGDLVH